MSDSFRSLCDDFYVDMFVNTELDLPSDRDIVLSFFDRVQKQYPTMSNFYRRENGDFCLEDDREKGSYGWLVLEVDRICSGYNNPETLEDAYQRHCFVNSLLPYMLGVNHLDITSLDLSFTMSLDYQGNQDEIINEAFLSETPFASILDIPNCKPIGFSPRVIYSLSDDCRTQLRISIESKTTVYEVRSGKYNSDQPILLTASLRQYHKPDERFDLDKYFNDMSQHLESIMVEKVIPGFLKPLVNAIAHRR